MTFAVLLQLLASISTIATSWLYGNKSVWGPTSGIVCQVFWWGIMIDAALWGLLPLNIVMLAIHIRNFMKWKREA